MQEGTLHNWFGKSKSKDGKPGWVQSDGSPCANEPGEKGTPKCYSSRRLAGLKKTKEGKKKIRSADARKSRQDPGQQSKSGAAKPTMVRTFKDPKDYKKHKSGDYKSEAVEMNVNEAKDKKGSGSGSKDACYHKVKSRYSVWPSAYASGALVKCRKVGAANWGNSSKNEEFMALPEFSDVQINAMRKAGIEVEVVDEACWKGYEKKGMKTMFGKRYPNCVKKTKSEEVENVEELYKGKHGQSEKEYQDSRSDAGKMISGDSKVSGSAYSSRATSSTGPNPAGGSQKPKGQGRMGSKDREYLKYRKGMMKKEEVTGGILVQDAQDFTPREIESVDIIKPEPIKGGQLQEIQRTKVQTGNMYQVIFGWRGKMMMVKLFFPDASVPNRQKVANALDKMYPGAQLRSYSHSVVDYDDPYINVGEETIHEEKKCNNTAKGEKCEVHGNEDCTVKEAEDFSQRDKIMNKAKPLHKHLYKNLHKKDSDGDVNEDYNDDVQSRMDSQEKSQQNRIHKKHRISRLKQNKKIHEHSNWRDDFVFEDEMKGLTVKGGHKRSVKQGAGLTQKGVDAVNRKTGGNLKTAVTTPPSKLKPGSKAANRRKSFCARSRGWTGERGKAARRRWNC